MTGQTQYRADIDGLRAIAVTSVVAYHAEIFPFRSGLLGVDIFFVISGYLIGGILLRGAKTNDFNISKFFSDFYGRRVRRILPALFLVLVVTLAIGASTLGPVSFARLAQSTGTSALGISNFQFWRDVSYFDPDAHGNPLLMTWSLGVEEQFYLIFPWLAVLLRRQSRKVTIATLASLTAGSFLLSVWATSAYPKAAFYLLPTRAWELGVGVFLAAWQLDRTHSGKATPWLSNILGWAGLAMTIASLIIFGRHTPFPGWAALLPVAGAAALLLADDSFVNRRLLSSRPAVFIGLVSYSWYLWHWPLMTYVRICSALPLRPWVLPGVAAFSLCLAYLSWRFIETPFRRKKLAPRSAFIRYAVGVLAVVASAPALAGAELSDPLATQAGKLEAIVQQVHGDKCLAQWGNRVPSTSPACLRKLAGRRTIAILGDSHAAALGQALPRAAERAGWGSIVFAKASCPPLLGVTVWHSDQPGFAADCAAFMNSAVSQVATDPDVTTVILVARWALEREAEFRPGSLGVNENAPERSLLATGLGAAVERLVASGKRVVVVRDTPVWAFDPIEVAMTEASPVRKLIARLSNGEPNGTTATLAQVAGRDAEVEIALDRVARERGVQIFDPHPLFCDTRTCRFRSGNVLLFADPSHMTPAAADLVLQALLSSIAGLGPTGRPTTTGL